MTDAVVPAVSRTLRTLADGTVRLQIDFEPNDRAAAMDLFSDPGTPLAVAALSQEASVAHLRKAPGRALKGPYGDDARALHASGFFRVPEVWRALGTDKEYLEWCKGQPCCVSGKIFGPHNGDIVAAHVRRIADGAGTGIKPDFSAIPLCASHHHEQHQKGESALGGKEQFNTQRIIHLEKWAHERLCEVLEVESLTEASPEALLHWATNHEVERYLPREIRDGGEQ